MSWFTRRRKPMTLWPSFGAGYGSVVIPTPEPDRRTWPSFGNALGG